jgi:hypothetical protein
VKVTPELFAELLAEAVPEPHAKPGTVAAIVADKAAQWGADQELEACRQLLEINKCPSLWIDLMMSLRRPKPLSLRQQATIELDEAVMRGDCITVSDVLPILRRAIEALPDE